MMKATQTHNFHLDFAKILAIVGVVFLHISDGYLLREDYFGSGGTWYVIFILRVLAGASVPIFMMTSGYLTIGKNYCLVKLGQRILVRLLIPFIFLFIITTWLSGVVAAQLHNTSLQTPLPVLAQELTKFFTAPGGLHFLVALIGLNVLLPVWNVVFGEKESKRNFLLAKYLIVMGMVVALTMTLNLNFNPNLSGAILNEWRWLLWVGYFCLGYLLKVQPNLGKRWWAGVAFGGGFLVSFGVSLLVRKLVIMNPGNEFLVQLGNISLDYHSPWIVMMSVGAWVLLVKNRWRFLEKKFGQKMVAMGASLSLGIYILHGLVHTHLDVFERWGLDNMLVWRRPAFAVLGLTEVTILISGALTYVLGKIPVLRLLVGKDEKT